jgi:hypothetical protein
MMRVSADPMRASILPLMLMCGKRNGFRIRNPERQVLGGVRLGRD